MNIRSADTCVRPRCSLPGWMTGRLFFDPQDHALLSMINAVLTREQTASGGLAHSDSNMTLSGNGKLLDPRLHPHGIKELAMPYDQRIAWAVMNLLDSLEQGQAEDRLLALCDLREEVLRGTMTTFRYNTGRLLIQIMKELVRAYGDYTHQLRHAHDFRSAITGQRRIVRKLLRRYHLFEMPENQGQLAFDHHVHDVNTKGRKTPTHLIMDAWIKGIRSLIVIYYNFVSPASATELMRAAAIMQIKVKIGIEYKAGFHGRYISLIWHPAGFDDDAELAAFLCEPQTAELMSMGGQASAYYAEYVMDLLRKYNSKRRETLSRELGIVMPPVAEDAFLRFVGAGQPSTTHLSEFIYRECLPSLLRRYQELEQGLKLASPEQAVAYEENMARIRVFDPNAIRTRWLGGMLNQELPAPYMSHSKEAVPVIMRLSIPELVQKLLGIRRSFQLTLNLAELGVADLLEILYDCQGAITHLEIYNSKNNRDCDNSMQIAISKLQLAINRGSSVTVKRLILGLLREDEHQSSCFQKAGLSEEQRVKLTTILHSIEKLLGFYRVRKLKSTVGSDSTGRFDHLPGMGFACMDTLPRRTLRELKRCRANGDFQRIIPLKADIDSVVTFTSSEDQPHTGSMPFFFRFLPGVSGQRRATRLDWSMHTEWIRYTATGNICILGGLPVDAECLPWMPGIRVANEHSRWEYLNSTLINVIKVLIGFIAAMATFLYTQSWFALAFFGAPIWFAITGLRNIAQAVLGVGGLRRSPLLRWNNYVSWSRLCDSLLYTGLSVPLLELLTRRWLLEEALNISPTENEWLFYAVMSTVNAMYIVGHNLYRGFPTSAVVGNIFRSALAIPVSVVYSQGAELLLSALVPTQADILLAQFSSITSKLASDTVAGIIEGLADRSVNIKAAARDYHRKASRIFAEYTSLEMLLPEEESVLKTLIVPKNLQEPRQDRFWILEKNLIIDSLDLMYFWLYQPRSRAALQNLIKELNLEERQVFCQAQYILEREREVTLLFLHGIFGKNFARPLAFFLAEHSRYLQELSKLCGMKRME